MYLGVYFKIEPYHDKLVVLTDDRGALMATKVQRARIILKL